MLNYTIAGYLQGGDTPFEDALAHVERDAPAELVETLRLVPDHIDDSQLETSGYVIHTLQTALYDALTADSAEELS